MGCLSVKITRVGGVSASLERIGGDLTASMARRGGVTARMGLVCGTNIGSIEVLYVQDGPLLTVDGGYLYVLKQRPRM